MFERFTTDARTVVAGAQDEARALRHPSIGSEHLCLSMLEGASAAGQLLRDRGMSAKSARTTLRAWEGTAEPLDPDALAAFGIDLDAVRRATEEQFGPGALDARARHMPRGHLPFTRRAKKILELALREAVALRSGEINSAHVLLGLLADGGGLGARLIGDAGVDLDELRTAARTSAAQRAA